MSIDKVSAVNKRQYVLGQNDPTAGRGRLKELDKAQKSIDFATRF